MPTGQYVHTASRIVEHCSRAASHFVASQNDNLFQRAQITCLSVTKDENGYDKIPEETLEWQNFRRNNCE